MGCHLTVAVRNVLRYAMSHPKNHETKLTEDNGDLFLNGLVLRLHFDVE
jgi:hypothetical protein